MKVTVFTCLSTSPDSLNRDRCVRARMTLDTLQPEYVGLYIFKGSEHHSCNHAPTAVTPREYEDLLAHLFRWSDGSLAL